MILKKNVKKHILKFQIILVVCISAKMSFCCVFFLSTFTKSRQSQKNIKYEIQLRASVATELNSNDKCQWDNVKMQK